MKFNFGMGLPTNVAQPIPGTFVLPAESNFGMSDLGFLNQGTSPAAALPSLGNVGQQSWTDQLKAMLGGTPLATTTAANGMKTQGMFDMGLGALQGGLGAYLGFQNLGIAKDTLAQNKRQFDLNFGAQQKTTNTRMADRQASRVAANPVAYSPVAEYMAKNGI